MVGFWVTARTSRPKPGAFHQPEEEGEEQQGQHEDGDADVADRDHVVEGERAIQPCGRGQRAGLGAEDVFQDLLQRDRDAEGGQQGFQRAFVEVADDQTLHRDACGEGDGEGERQGDQDRGGVVRHVKLHDIAGVGAHGDELAMGHVDHAHHAEGDRKADGGEEVDRGERQAVEGKVGGLHGGDLVADGFQGGACGGCDGGVGFGVDVVEMMGGEGGCGLVIGGGLRDGACGFQRGIGAVAGGLGVQIGQGDAADFAVLQVGDQGGALGFNRQAGGGEVGGYQQVIGFGLGQVAAGF